MESHSKMDRSHPNARRFLGTISLRGLTTLIIPLVPLKSALACSGKSVYNVYYIVRNHTSTTLALKFRDPAHGRNDGDISIPAFSQKETCGYSRGFMTGYESRSALTITLPETSPIFSLDVAEPYLGIGYVHAYSTKNKLVSMTCDGYTTRPNDPWDSVGTGSHCNFEASFYSRTYIFLDISPKHGS